LRPLRAPPRVVQRSVESQGSRCNRRWFPRHHLDQLGHNGRLREHRSFGIFWTRHNRHGCPRQFGVAQHQGDGDHGAIGRRRFASQPFYD
ncbi:unnamed protein product, partial [Ectocarpus sp. 13 AM-2016]